MKTLKSPGKLRVTRCPKDLGRGYVIWDGFAYDSPLTIYASKEAAQQALTPARQYDESRFAVDGDNV